MSYEFANRREFLRSNLGAALSLGLTGTSRSTARARRPNFVFILADDLGWSDLGCYGSDFYESPNLDRLAASGTRFTDAYAACPVCSPTRASIMTGKYPPRAGITDYIPGLTKKNTKLLTPEDIHQLPYAEVTMAEALKEAGYQTFMAGKWRRRRVRPRQAGLRRCPHQAHPGLPGRLLQGSQEPGVGIPH